MNRKLKINDLDCTGNFGFTLVEMLIALGIMALLVGGGIANYYRLNLRKQVEEAARFAETAIRFTQKQATSGVKPIPGCGVSTTLESYRIAMNGNTHTISARCDTTYFNVKTNETLPHGAIYNAATTIDFDVDGMANANSNVCVRDAGSNFSFAVQVLTGGSISFQGFVAVCP